MKKFMVYGLSFMVFTLYTIYYIPYTFPAYAFNIGDKFGFGDFTSFGDILSKLVTPVFSVAATLVIIYFLWGAFDLIKSGSNKEEIAGAREKITHAIIGFIILIFAFLILQFLLFSLFGFTGFQLFQS